FLSVVSSLGMYMRLQGTQEVFHGCFTEKDNIVNTFKGCNYFSPFQCWGHNLFPLAEPCHRQVVIYGHDKHIPQSPGTLQVPHVTHMEKVEAAVSENDPFALSLFFIYDAL